MRLTVLVANVQRSVARSHLESCPVLRHRDSRKVYELIRIQPPRSNVQVALLKWQQIGHASVSISSGLRDILVGISKLHRQNWALALLKTFQERCFDSATERLDSLALSFLILLVRFLFLGSLLCLCLLPCLGTGLFDLISDVLTFVRRGVRL